MLCLGQEMTMLGGSNKKDRPLLTATSNPYNAVGYYPGTIWKFLVTRGRVLIIHGMLSKGVVMSKKCSLPPQMPSYHVELD